MFSSFYVNTAEQVYRGIHFAYEQIEKKGIDTVVLSDLVEKSRTEDLSFQELAFVSRAKGQVDSLEEMLRNNFRSTVGQVRYIAPTFQTNNCIDVCRECGWNRDTNPERVSLTADQFNEELGWLKKHGFGVIEISNATNAKFLEWNSLKGYMDKVKKNIDLSKGEGFGICSALFSDEVMAKLFPEHAQFWVQWMETYDMPSYFKVHRFTNRIPEKMQRYSKADFFGRLDSYDKVMHLGGDVMLGTQYGLNLTNSSFDTLMTIAHARYLRDEYGREPLAFGTVTNNSYGTKTEKYADGLENTFTEQEYRVLLGVLKLGMPSVGRWLNTRVPFSLIEGAILSNDCYTGECSDMVPGKREGIIKLSNAQAGQFRVYENPKDIWETNLSRLGLGINYRWMQRQEEAMQTVLPLPVERAHRKVAHA